MQAQYANRVCAQWYDMTASSSGQGSGCCKHSSSLLVVPASKKQ